MGNIVFGIIGAIIFAVSSIYVGINPIIGVIFGIGCGVAIATAVMSLFARLAVFAMMSWAFGVAFAVIPIAIMPKSFDDLISRRQPVLTIGRIERQSGKQEVLQGNCKTEFEETSISSEVTENPEQAFALIKSLEIVCRNGILNENKCQTARLKILKLTK